MTTGRQRPVRRRRLLHRRRRPQACDGADARPQPDRDRPAHRRRATTTSGTSGSASTAAASPASASSAATARAAAAPASRRRSATSSRSTTSPTRWATSSAATTRSTARRRTAPAATAARPPRSSRAAARRSWPTPASAARTTCSRTATRTSRSAAIDEITTYVDLEPPGRSTRCRPSRCATSTPTATPAAAPGRRGLAADRARLQLHAPGHRRRGQRQRGADGRARRRAVHARRYLGAESGPITPGQNNTQLGILNAIQGGNEQQVVTLTGFNGDHAVVPGPDRRRHLGRARRRRPAVSNATSPPRSTRSPASPAR